MASGVVPPLLDVTDLTISFHDRPVVAGVSFAIAPGRTLGVVGESGCGKSMTALALIGLVPPPGVAKGSITLQGRSLLIQSATEWQAMRGRDIAMVFQEPMTALNPTMRVGHQIAEVLVLHKGLSWHTAELEAVSMLSSVGIADAKQRAVSYPHELSGGMRQRAMIAMALACEPALLIADEPTTALDVTIQAEILDLMQDLQDRIGMAMLFISHNLAVVSEVAHDIIVMYAGRIVEQASADTLFQNPRHPYTRGLIATLPDPDRPTLRLPVIPGHVGTSAHATGCRFSDRCEYAEAACRAAEPPLRPHADGHLVACFRG